MGLDRNAAAMMVAASDDRGAAGAEDAEFMARVFRSRCHQNAFQPPIRSGWGVRSGPPLAAIPPWRPRAHCCWRTSACTSQARRTGRRVAKIAAEADLTISVIAHAGDGNTHPLIVYTRRRGDDRACRRPSATSWTSRSHWAAPSPANTGGPAEEAVAGRATGPGSHGTQPPDQAALDPTDSQPRCGHLTRIARYRDRMTGRRRLHDEARSWTSRKSTRDWWMVLCGTVGLYERAVLLEPDEVAAGSGTGQPAWNPSPGDPLQRALGRIQPSLASGPHPAGERR